MSLPWRKAWITGASTGIGLHTALKLAEQGVQVTISARSADTLTTAASRHPNLTALALDVSDAKAVRTAAAAIGPCDLVLFGAGAYAPVSLPGLDPELFARIMAVNYQGVVNGLAAVLPEMMARRAGQIAWIASVAGYRGLPKAAAYGPSKAALINLAESLKPELDRAGVVLSVINPGFVETPMTAVNDFKMPFLMSPEAAADRVIEGLSRRKFEIAFPRRFALLLKLGRVLPYSWYFAYVRKFVLKD